MIRVTRFACRSIASTAVLSAVATRRWLTAKRQRQAAQPNASPTRISRAALAGGCAQDRDAWGKQERQDRITNLIISYYRPGGCRLEHDPEKCEAVFPRDKREAFARRSCSNNNLKRDDDSSSSHRALYLAGPLFLLAGRKSRLPGRGFLAWRRCDDFDLLFLGLLGFPVAPPLTFTTHVDLHWSFEMLELVRPQELPVRHADSQRGHRRDAAEIFCRPLHGCHQPGISVASA
jgi:hypothetical protein